MATPEDPDAPGGRVSIEELADLQAGLLTATEESALRVRVDADPAAADLLGLLRQAGEDLAHLDDEPVPDDVAARVDAAIAAEAAGDAVAARPAGGPVIDLARERSRRRRWLGPGLAGLAAAAVGAVVVGAVVVGAVVVGAVLGAPEPGRPQPGSAPVAPSITVAELGTQWPGVEGTRELGFLAAPDKLDRCLLSSVSSLSFADDVLGARPLVVDGQHGVLVAVPTGLPEDPRRPAVLLVVLGPNCAASVQQPDVIARTIVPR